MMAADIILTNAIVYGMHKSIKCIDTVAIKGDRIVGVGDFNDVQALINETTRVIDVDGGMVLPGMIDSHIHPPGNKLYELFDIDLNNVKSEEEVNHIIESFIATNDDQAIFYGSGLDLAVFSDGEEGEKGPCKERLDKFCKDKPIIINTNDMHSMWANSKAFEVAGISASTEDPEGGRIERVDDTNEPWGMLREKPAGDLMPKQEFTVEQKKLALLEFQKMMHKLGITGIFSLPGIVDVTNELYELAREGRLKLRVTGAYYVWPEDVAGKTIKEQILEAAEWRDRFSGFEDVFKITTLKYACDGVVEGITAGVIEPYENAAGKPQDYHGEFLFTDEEMNLISDMGSEYGFQIHVHSIGDLATRKVLNSFEQTRVKRETKSLRNTITHLQLVDEEDVKRFADLDVIASVQPYWMKKEPIWYERIEKAFLGDRAEKQYPLKSFFDNGVIVASSSDHGVTVRPYPFVGIEGGVTRNLTTHQNYGINDISDMNEPKYLLNPDERATVEEMIDSFTINGAYQAFRDEEIGTIEEGKLADLVVIDRDITCCNPIEIEDVKLEMTIFGGEIVYSK